VIHRGAEGALSGQPGAHDRQPYLVFDIGGTTLRGALYDPGADVLLADYRRPTRSRWASPTTSSATLREALVDDLRAIGDRLLPRPAVVSIGFPGPVDERGNVLAAPTIFGSSQEAEALRSLLEGTWPSAEVLILNDVTAAGYGIATGPREDFCVVTVSSGVGCKVFLDGRPILGRSGRRGELGHLRVDPSSEANICECGGRGHLGGMASGRGALAIARRLLGAGGAGLTCEQLVLAFYRDDPVATSVITDAAGALATALAGLHTALGLERFVLTGGFAAALGDRFRQLVAQAAVAACWDLGQDWDDMVELHASDDAGLVGAGRYAHRLACADARTRLVRDAVPPSLVREETVAVGRFGA